MGSIYRSIRKLVSHFQANGGCQSSLPSGFQNFKLVFLERKVSKTSNCQAHPLHLTKLQKKYGEKTVIRSVKVRCEILLLHLTLMDHLLLPIKQVLTVGCIHSSHIIKPLDVSVLRSYNGKYCLDQIITRLVNLNFLCQLGFLSLRIKRK